MPISLDDRILEVADASGRRVQEILEKASDITAALESPVTDPNSLLRGMSHVSPHSRR
jgi:autophagy-related protein 11